MFQRETDSAAVHDGYVSITRLRSLYGPVEPVPAVSAHLKAALDRLLPDLPGGQVVRVSADQRSRD